MVRRAPTKQRKRIRQIASDSDDEDYGDNDGKVDPKDLARNPEKKEEKEEEKEATTAKGTEASPGVRPQAPVHDVPPAAQAQGSVGSPSLVPCWV